MFANDLNTNCTDAPGTFLTCTLPDSKALVQGLRNLFIGCKDEVGNENVSSTSDALLINATNVTIQAEAAAWKLVNFTEAYNARTDRFDNENFSTRLGTFMNAFFNNNNWTTLYDNEAGTRFGISNYSNEYDSTGYKLSNFTTNYDARTNRFDNENFTTQYGTEYDSTGYKLGNLSSDLLGTGRNFTFINASQDLIVLGNVGIGTTAPGVKLKVDGSMNVTQNLSVGGTNVSFTGLPLTLVQNFDFICIDPDGNLFRREKACDKIA